VWWYWALVATGPILVLVVEAGLRHERSIPKLVGWTLFGCVLGLFAPLALILLGPETDLWPWSLLGLSGVAALALVFSRSAFIRRAVASITALAAVALLGLGIWVLPQGGWAILVTAVLWGGASLLGFFAYILFRVPGVAEPG
jgi:hypothetical protein